MGNKYGRIAERRKYIGMTATDLAAKIEVSKQTVYKYENGIIQNIPVNKLEAIAKALNTTVAYLSGWTDDPSQNVNINPFIKVESKVSSNGLTLSNIYEQVQDLDDRQLNKLRTFVDFLIDQNNGKKEQ